MSQIILEVRLYCEKVTGEDILSFQFDDGEGKVSLNSDSSQEQLKEVFVKLIQLCIEDDVKLQFTIDETQGKVLYKEVCEEYIHELQKEIDIVKDRIKKEFGCE